MTTSQRIAIACLSVMLAAPAALAQERIEVFSVAADGRSAQMTEIDVGVTDFGMVHQRTTLPAPSQANTRGRAPLSLVPLAGNRYLLWLNQGLGSFDGSIYSIFDRRTRTVIHTDVQESARKLLRDPIRPRLFIGPSGFGADIFGPVRLFDATKGGVTAVGPYMGGFGNPEVSMFDYAPAADRVAVVVRDPNGGADRVETIDVRSNAVRSSVPFKAGMLRNIRISADARTVYLGTYDENCTSLLCLGTPAPIRAIDTATGQERARSVPLPLFERMELDESRGFLFVPQSGGVLVVLDATTLQTLGTLTTGTSAEAAVEVLPGRGSTSAYVVRWTSGGAVDCGRRLVTALDLFGRPRATVDVLAAVGVSSCTRLAMSSVMRAPEPPKGLRATVTGANVAISWTNPGDTTEFELQVGLSPGTTALTIPVGPASSIAFAGVPRGQYFLRVRGVNEIGRGLASSELVVTVP